MNIQLTQQAFSAILLTAIQKTGSGLLFGTKTEATAECCGIISLAGTKNEQAIQAAHQLLPGLQLTGAYDIRPPSNKPWQPGKQKADWAERTGVPLLLVVQMTTDSEEQKPLKLFCRSYESCEFTYETSEDPLQAPLACESRSIGGEIGGIRFEMRGYHLSGGKWKDAPLFASEATVLLALQGAFGEVSA